MYCQLLPQRKKRKLLCRPKHLCTFFPSGCRGAKIAHAEHSFVTFTCCWTWHWCLRAHVLVFSSYWHTSVSACLLPMFSLPKVSQVEARRGSTADRPVQQKICRACPFHFSWPWKYRRGWFIAALSDYTAGDQCGDIFQLVNTLLLPLCNVLLWLKHAGLFFILFSWCSF